MSVEQMLLANKKLKERTQLKYERFAYEYLIDYDLIRAYKCIYDEDRTMSDESARVAGSKILRSITVQNIIDKEECRVLTERRLQKDDVIAKMQRLYSNSMRDRDYASAKGALDMLAKHFGLYHAHNKQKKYSADDVASIRQKLEANGLVLDAPNKPLELSSQTSIGKLDDVQDAEVVSENNSIGNTNLNTNNINSNTNDLNDKIDKLINGD